jgi:hypothetical protein
VPSDNASAEMNSDKETTPFRLFAFAPFPKYSVNIITGPTFVGKTYFITQLINHHKVYFASPIGRVIVVLCNSRVQTINFDPDLDVPVEQILLSDFVSDHLENNDLVVIDDLQHITHEVKVAISVCAHHQGLASLFVVTHSLLGSSNFELLRLCHRIFLFLGSIANKQLTKYIFDNYFTDPEVKTYLRQVLNFCSRENQVLALELSPVGPSPQILLAFSHLSKLLTHNYCYLYPWPHFGKSFAQRFETSPPVKLASNMSISFPDKESIQNLPENTLLALPVQYVADQVATEHATTSGEECADRRTWDTTLEDIEDNIESFFPIKRWKVCKNLAKEILSNSNFCVTRDGKQFHLVNKPNTKVNLMSFIGLATRKAGPSEKVRRPEWNVYNPHVQQLLANGTPKELFVNTLLLNKKMKKK